MAAPSYGGPAPNITVIACPITDATSEHYKLPADQQSSPHAVQTWCRLFCRLCQDFATPDNSMLCLQIYTLRINCVTP